MRLPPELVGTAREIELLVLDADGVLTDGGIHYDGHDETVRFHVHDGLGIRLLIEAGVEVAVVTGRGSPALARRVAELEVGHFYPRTRDKLAVVEALAASLGVPLERVAFVGDDLVDLPVLRAVGLSVSVPNGHAAVTREVDWVAPREGGHGAVRAVADAIVDAKLGEGEAVRRFVRGLRPTPSADVSFGVVIPARYGSTRLPGKPLLELAGKPMIVHVLENARRSRANFVAVATDDERIAEVVRAAGGEAFMTSPDHASGTDRVAEVARRKGLGPDAIVVNVQGDEPLLDPTHIDAAAVALGGAPRAGVATLATPIDSVEQLVDPSVVKVVVDKDDCAVSFSRAPIPFVRDLFRAHEVPEALPPEPTFLRHLGLYAYRVGALHRVTSHPPVAMERAEALEQLRMLWLGIRIHLTVVDDEPAHGVDTPADREAMEALLRARDA